MATEPPLWALRDRILDAIEFPQFDTALYVHDSELDEALAMLVGIVGVDELRGRLEYRRRMKGSA